MENFGPSAVLPNEYEKCIFIPFINGSSDVSAKEIVYLLEGVYILGEVGMITLLQDDNNSNNLCANVYFNAWNDDAWIFANDSGTEEKLEYLFPTPSRPEANSLTAGKNPWMFRNNYATPMEGKKLYDTWIKNDREWAW